MERLKRGASFAKNPGAPTYNKAWDEPQRVAVLKLLKMHPAGKEGVQRWKEITNKVNNPPLTPVELKAKEKRDEQRKRRAEALRSDDEKVRASAPPDPGPEPTGAERGVPQRSMGEVWSQIPLCHELKLRTAGSAAIVDDDATQALHARVLPFTELKPCDASVADSQKERRARRLFNEEFNYAELDPVSLLVILQKLKAVHGQFQVGAGAPGSRRAVLARVVVFAASRKPRRAAMAASPRVASCRASSGPARRETRACEPRRAARVPTRALLLVRRTITLTGRARRRLVLLGVRAAGGAGARGASSRVACSTTLAAALARWRSSPPCSTTSSGAAASSTLRRVRKKSGGANGGSSERASRRRHRE